MCSRLQSPEHRHAPLPQSRPTALSRALLLALDQNQVTKECEAQNVGISAIEALASGGVRLVCNSSDGAALIGKKLKRHLIHGEVTRERHRPAAPLW